MKGALVGLLALVSLAATASADEIRLKDGTKISGTIVGFEDNSFKVQTSYGFALVRKDKIAAIIPSEAKKETATEASKPAAEAKKTVAAENKPSAPEKKTAPPPLEDVALRPAAPAVSPAALAAKKEPAPRAAAKAEVAPKPVAVPAPGKDATAAALLTGAATPSAARAAPAAASAPPVNREEVQGNLYINYTYGFRMYKPPGWHVIEGAQKALPTAIVAMGTGDETTLLVVGREGTKDSLEAHATATERQLRDIYENYRRISEQRQRLAGLPAIARRYRGTVDGHDWSGVILSLARGNDVFTILGMTYADSDLIQIQENVIARAIASLEFTPR